MIVDRLCERVRVRGPRIGERFQAILGEQRERQRRFCGGVAT